MTWQSFLRPPWLLGLVAGALFALLVTDEIVRSDEPFTFTFLFFELLDMALLVGCTVTAALVALRVRAQEEDHRLLRRDLEVIRADNRRWRAEMADNLRELAAAIQRQFDAWRLTAAEQEIGFLLLKGFSHKEIARLRKSSEATIRQQAASIYQKANLSGRTALSAFFLEDLLAPPRADGAGVQPRSLPRLR